MTSATQISASIWEKTKDLLEKYVKATGIKKGRLSSPHSVTIFARFTNCPPT